MTNSVPVNIYKLQLTDTFMPSKFEDEIVFGSPAPEAKGFTPNPRNPYLLPVPEQPVPLRRIMCQNAYTAEEVESRRYDFGKNIFEKQRMQVGRGKQEIFEDISEKGKKFIKYRTISAIGIYFDETVPEFLRGKIDLEYIERIEIENGEMERKLKKLKQELKRTKVFNDSLYEQNQSILHGSITGFLLLRLRIWLIKIKTKIKYKLKLRRNK